MSTDGAINRLAKLDTCAVSDALDRLGLKGAVLGLRPLWPCPRIVGRAVTVKIKPAGLEKRKQHLCTPAIAAATASDIIVVDHGGRTDVAAWGGLLSLAAQIKRSAASLSMEQRATWTKAASWNSRCSGAARCR